ncbi:MAG TPA: hypothetical protein VK939_03740 [Longimicrobiales bacterium]|nr:hypothetical protein [Longimicrobiales bacterium]
MSTERDRDDAQLAELLRHLDHPLPPITAEDIAARAQPRERPWLRIAAGIALAIALGSVAYALPGSPLPRWVDTVGRMAGGTEATSAPAPSAPAPAPAPGGLSFDPNEPLAVVISAAQAGATLHVSLREADAIVLVTAPGVARFTSEPGMVRVAPLAAGALELHVPRTAVQLVVSVEGRQVFLLEHGAVAATVSADASGRYVFPLDPR